MTNVDLVYNKIQIFFKSRLVNRNRILMTQKCGTRFETSRSETK